MGLIKQLWFWIRQSKLRIYTEITLKCQGHECEHCGCNGVEDMHKDDIQALRILSYGKLIDNELLRRGISVS